MKAVFIIGMFLVIGCASVSAQIMEPNEDRLTRQMVRENVKNARKISPEDTLLTKAERDSLFDAIIKNLESADDTLELSESLDTTLKAFNVIGDTKKNFITIKDTVEFILDDRKKGRFLLQHDGTAKTDVRLTKFTLSRRSLNVPVYIVLSPEVKFTEEKDDEEQKAKQLLSSTGGILSVTAKKYYELPLSSNDLYVRWMWLFSTIFLNNLDSLNEKYKPDFRVLAGVGINIEAEITGEHSGNLWIESQATYSATNKDAFKEIFGENANTSFFGFTSTANLRLIDFIDIKFQYFKSFNSKIPSLDNGFSIFSIGVAAHLK